MLGAKQRIGFGSKLAKKSQGETHQKLSETTVWPAWVTEIVITWAATEENKGWGWAPGWESIERATAGNNMLYWVVEGVTDEVDVVLEVHVAH